MLHSIFLRITLFFLITFIGMVAGLYALHQKLSQEHTYRLEREAGNLLVILRQSILLDPSSRRSFLQEQGYSTAEPHPNLIKTLHNALTNIPKDYPEAIQDSLREGRIQILKDDKHLYIHLPKAAPPLLVIKTGIAQRSLWFEVLAALSLFVLLLLYWMIIKTLSPLKNLTHAINGYALEGKYTAIRNTGKNEIALVANALDRAMHKNQTLLDARKLFLRNIMHELKTPITAGKLTLPFLKKSDEKSILERAFLRMEHLIAELVRVEQITSGALAPHLQTCDPKKLIDKAKELLFLNDSVIEMELDESTINADCEVLLTAFKNLIDNGLKYSLDQKVTIVQKEGIIGFYNTGEAWDSEYTLESLSEPFSHQHDNTQSFGLGLYIIKSILDAHHFTLTHRYELGIHCFEILYRNPLSQHD